MSDVFISYSRRDEEAVKQIIKSLTRRGIEVWIDKEDIGTGSRWDMQIQEGINNCKKVLVMLSKASIVSQNVGDEWGYAIEKSKHIIPVLLEDCDVPMRLASLQRIEFVEDYDTAIDKLTAEIRAESEEKEAKAPEAKARKFKAPRPVMNALKFGLPALLLMGLALFGYHNFLITVPSLDGLAPETARQVLQANHLSLGKVTWEYSDADSDPAGKVFRVEPAQAKIYDAINIYIAKEKVSVPDVVGLNESQAKSLLENVGLQFGKIVVEEADAEEFSIFKQEPLPDTLVREAAPVDLYVVKEKIVIPDVVGLDQAGAVAALEAKNLKVTLVHSVTRWNTNYGKIFEMEPTAGEKVNSNHEVKIWLADFGGWIYLGEGDVGDIMKTHKGFNLRNEPDASSRKTVIDSLPKGSRVKILHALENGWRLVREYNPEAEEEMHAQL